MSLDNTYLQAQIINQIQMVENFKSSCRIATLKDDGITSKKEQKLLDKITKESDAYIKGLRKLVD